MPLWMMDGRMEGGRTPDCGRLLRRKDYGEGTAEDGRVDNRIDKGQLVLTISNSLQSLLLWSCLPATSLLSCTKREEGADLGRSGRN